MFCVNINANGKMILTKFHSSHGWLFFEFTENSMVSLVAFSTIQFNQATKHQKQPADFLANHNPWPKKKLKTVGLDCSTSQNGCNRLSFIAPADERCVTRYVFNDCPMESGKTRHPLALKKTSTSVE